MGQGKEPQTKYDRRKSRPSKWAGLTCTYEGCDAPVYTRHICKRHYDHEWRAAGGTKNKGHWGKNKGKTCSVEGCGKPAKAKGMCISHYDKSRWAAGEGRRSAEKNRDAHLMYRYGISLADYNRLWEEQGGRCAICGEPPGPHSTPPNWKGKLAVDHCHDSTRVRALLCNPCNLIVGYGATVDTLERAIEYLRTHTRPDSENYS